MPTATPTRKKPAGTWSPKHPDPVIRRMQALRQGAGLSYDELAKRMGYPDKTHAWQALNRSSDPRLSTLRRFARALGIPLAELLAER